MGILEGEERGKGTESLFKEKIIRNFQTWGRNWLICVFIQVQEANKTPNYLNAKRTSLRHIMLKLPKVND